MFWFFAKIWSKIKKQSNNSCSEMHKTRSLKPQSDDSLCNKRRIIVSFVFEVFKKIVSLLLLPLLFVILSHFITKETKQQTKQQTTNDKTSYLFESRKTLLKRFLFVLISLANQNFAFF
jgi:hypothetical protein